MHSSYLKTSIYSTVSCVHTNMSSSSLQMAAGFFFFFFQKCLALRCCSGLLESLILAGCSSNYTVVPSQCAKERSVVQKSERQHCHRDFACMTVPGIDCKAFLSLLFSYLFLSLQYLLVAATKNT